MTRFFLLRPSQIRSILGHTCLSCQETQKKLNKWIAPPPRKQTWNPQNESLEDDFQIPCECSEVHFKVHSITFPFCCSGLAFGPLQIMRTAVKSGLHVAVASRHRLQDWGADVDWRVLIHRWYLGFYLCLALETCQHIGGIEQIQLVKENLAWIFTLSPCFWWPMPILASCLHIPHESPRLVQPFCHRKRVSCCETTNKRASTVCPL